MLPLLMAWALAAPPPAPVEIHLEVGRGAVVDCPEGVARLATSSPETVDAVAASSHEVLFHATTVHATGGMLLSGDDLPTLTPEREAILRKLLPPTKRAASFADETLTVGRTPHGRGEYLYLFNWGDQPAERVVKLPRKVNLTNYWTGESLGQHAGEYRVPALAPHTALLLEANPAAK